MKKYYVDDVFVRNGEMYDRGYYICEDGTIEWFPPIAGWENEVFPINECFHESGLPIMIEDGELLGEKVEDEGADESDYYLYKDETAYFGKGHRYFVHDDPMLTKNYSGYSIIEESTDKKALEERAEQLQAEYDDQYAVFCQRLSSGDRYCIDHPDKGRLDSMWFIFEGTLEECQEKLEELEVEI